MYSRRVASSGSHTRELAIGRTQAQANALKATGIVGVSIDMKITDGPTVRFTAIGIICSVGALQALAGRSCSDGGERQRDSSRRLWRGCRRRAGGGLEMAAEEGA
jgi:hypothetical protein